MKTTTLYLALVFTGCSASCFASAVADVGVDSATEAAPVGHRHSGSHPRFAQHLRRHHVGLDCGPAGTGVGKSNAVFAACQHRMYPNCLAWNGAVCLQFQQSQ